MTKASIPKLLAYLAGLSLFVAYALFHPQNFTILGLGPLQTKINGDPSLNPQFKPLEFEMPMETLRMKFEVVGIPHFIIDAGVSVASEARAPATTIWHLMKAGQEIGFFSATYYASGDAKSNVDISFTAKDESAIKQLAKPFETNLVPSAFMVATMRENFSAQLERRRFNLSALNP